ncbi:hypothetical protein A5839_001849, partial [Enterococcus faecium]
QMYYNYIVKSFGEDSFINVY